MGKFSKLDELIEKGIDLKTFVPPASWFGKRIQKKAKKDPKFIERVVNNRNAVTDGSYYRVPVDWPCVGPCFDENGNPVWVQNAKVPYNFNDLKNFISARDGEGAAKEWFKEVELDPTLAAMDETNGYYHKAYSRQKCFGGPDEGFSMSVDEDGKPMFKYVRVSDDGKVYAHNVHPSVGYRDYKSDEGYLTDGFYKIGTDSYEQSGRNGLVYHPEGWNYDHNRVMRPFFMRTAINPNKETYSVDGWDYHWVNPYKMNKRDLDFIRNASHYIDRSQKKFETPYGWGLGDWKRNLSDKKTYSLKDLTDRGTIGKIRSAAKHYINSNDLPKIETDPYVKRYNGLSPFMEDAKVKADEIRSKKATQQAEEQRLKLEQEIEKLKKRLEKKNAELNKADSVVKAVGESVWKYPNLH